MPNDLDPYGWRSGPPKTESEGWNFERRGEVLKISTEIMVASVHGVIERDEYARQKLVELIDVEAIAELAVKLRDEVEKKCPRH